MYEDVKGMSEYSTLTSRKRALRKTNLDNHMKRKERTQESQEYMEDLGEINRKKEQAEYREIY